MRNDKKPTVEQVVTGMINAKSIIDNYLYPSLDAIECGNFENADEFATTLYEAYDNIIDIVSEIRQDRYPVFSDEELSDYWNATRSNAGE